MNDRIGMKTLYPNLHRASALLSPLRVMWCGLGVDSEREQVHDIEFVHGRHYYPDASRLRKHDKQAVPIKKARPNVRL